MEKEDTKIKDRRTQGERRRWQDASKERPSGQYRRNGSDRRAASAGGPPPMQESKLHSDHPHANNLHDQQFSSDGARAETSDSGYGSTSVALRDVLMKMEPVDAKPTQCKKHGGVNQYCSICLSDVAEKVAIGARTS